jgi:hypothetical protein
MRTHADGCRGLEKWPRFQKSASGGSWSDNSAPCGRSGENNAYHRASSVHGTCEIRTETYQRHTLLRSQQAIYMCASIAHLDTMP